MKAAGALRYPNFTRFLCARSLTVLAVQMQSVAVGWQVYALTGNTMDLGLVGLAQFLPFIVLVLPAGQIADRFERQKILTLCYSLEVICGLLMLAFTQLDMKTVWPVFSVMVLFGVARAFSMPSSQALIPNLVPIADLSSAVSLNTSTFQVATIAGPALGGALYHAGPSTVYGTVAAVIGISVFLMSGVRPREAMPRAPARRGGQSQSWHEVMEGLRFVASRPIVLGAISLDLFAVLFGGATALLPAYAKDVLHMGSAGAGFLRSAPAIGAALVALILAVAPIQRHAGRWMFGGVMLFGCATIVFGLSTTFVLSFLALILLGVGDMVSVYIRHMLVQLQTPDAIRGRVSAVNAVFIGASNELGEFESGATATWFGLVHSVVIGGIATLCVAGIWMRLFPSLRSLDRFPRPEAAA